MYARQPRYAWRGLAKQCGGAGGRAKQGSRAQARTDFAKGVLPGSKAPLSAMVMPTAETMERWAAALGRGRASELARGGGGELGRGAVRACRAQSSKGCRERAQERGSG